MLNAKKMKKAVVVVAVIGALMLSFGCTKHPNEEQIKVMEETRSAALSAEQKLEELKQQRKQVEDQLAQKQKEVQQAKDQKSEVEQRLEGWGNN